MSSREIGLKRREEVKTMSSQRQTATQGIQQNQQKTPAKEAAETSSNMLTETFPACMRLKKESSEDNAKKKNESLKGRG